MKKFLKYLAIALAVLFFWASVFFLGILYETRWKVTTVGTEVSPDATYEVVFQMVGEPAWPFGPTDVRMVLKNTDGKTLEKRDTILFNDGGALTPDCWSVQWAEDMVDVTLSGEEQEDAHYTLPLN